MNNERANREPPMIEGLLFLKVNRHSWNVDNFVLVFQWQA